MPPVIECSRVASEGVPVLAHDARDVGLDLLLAEPAKREPPADAGQAGEERGKLAHARLFVAVRAQHRNRSARDRLAEEAKQEQRSLVRGVEVLEHDQHRPLVGAVEQEARHRVEQREADALRIRLLRGRPCRGRGDLVEVPAGGAHHLDPRPVSRRAALLPATAREHRPLVCRRLVGHLREQPRLADAGIARDDHHAAAPGRGLVERLLQFLELAPTADERPRGAATTQRPRRSGTPQGGRGARSSFSGVP